MTRASLRWILASASALTVALAGCSGPGGDVEETALDACDDATHPIDVVTADLTGDGRDELAVSCQPMSGGWDPGAVEVYTVDGGGFTRAHSTTFDTAPKSVAVGDLDADGIQDLVVSISGPHERTLAVLLGDGDAGFVLAVDHVTSGELGRATLHDLTGNGDLELVKVPMAEPDEDDDELVVLPGSGDGTFDEPDRIDVDGFPYRVTVSDLAGDGDDDLVFVRMDGDRNDTGALRTDNGG